MTFPSLSHTHKLVITDPRQSQRDREGLDRDREREREIHILSIQNIKLIQSASDISYSHYYFYTVHIVLDIVCTCM